MAMDTMSQAIDMTFCTALLLIGAMKTAEAAVMQGIGACEDLSPRGLLIEASRAAVQRCTKSSDGPCEIERLPPELRRLFILQPLPRQCFVVRILYLPTRAGPDDLVIITDNCISDILICSTVLCELFLLMSRKGLANA